MADAFIYDAVRTPRGRGKPDGSLHEVPAVDLAVNGVHERLFDDPAGHGGLVGDHDRHEAGSLEQPERIGRPGKQRELLETIEVVALLDDRPVAIEKYGGSAHIAVFGICQSVFDVFCSGFFSRSTTVAITRSGERPLMHR